MPFTPAQRRLFAVKMKRGEISRAKFDRLMGEGVRRDVDRTGHAKKAGRRRKRKATRRMRR